MKLSIIGCGNVAKTLAYLWHRSSALEIVSVLNRTDESAQASVDFIGAGKPSSDLHDLISSDIYLLGCADDDIDMCFQQLLDSEKLKKGDIVFHCSGAKSAEVLSKAREKEVSIASLHPVKSFAVPENAIHTFKNTYCGLEGDEKAVVVLSTLLEAIDGYVFAVKPEQKLIYHAASVLASNYLVALQELSIKAFEHSGVERGLAMKILEPIVKNTAENIFNLGTASALTGPIARGDYSIVQQQFEAMHQWDDDAARVYQLLGKLCVDLSDEQGNSDKLDLDKIKTLLR